MTLRRVILAFAGTCALISASLRADAQNYPGYEKDLDASRTNTSLIIADIRPKLFDDLPPAELQIYNQIQFSVSSEDKIMNAYATHTGGVRRVVVTEAIGRAIKLNTDAFLIEQLYHKPGFLGNYMSFVCERYHMNYKRYAQGLPPLRIDAPYERAHMSDKDVDEFYSDSDVNKARNIALGGAFAFLLAHEVGHHIKGHVDHRAADLAGRREQESEADAWAIDLLVKKKLNPVDGMIPLLFFYYTDQNPIETEQQSDHPADARRLLRMYQGLSERLPSFRPYLVGVDYETAKKRVDYAISLIQGEISAGERDNVSGGGGTAAGNTPNSLAAESRSPFCEELNSFVSAAQDNFSSLRGRPDPDGGGEAFFALREITGFTNCDVWIYHDRSLEPAATCKALSENANSLRDSIQACLGAGWSYRAAGDYIFDGPRGIRVRVESRRSGKVILWVDSPPRD
jgi:hypothetical protein